MGFEQDVFDSMMEARERFDDVVSYVASNNAYDSMLESAYGPRVLQLDSFLGCGENCRKWLIEQSVSRNFKPAPVYMMWQLCRSSRREVRPFRLAVSKALSCRRGVTWPGSVASRRADGRTDIDVMVDDGCRLDDAVAFWINDGVDPLLRAKNVPRSIYSGAAEFPDFMGRSDLSAAAKQKFASGMMMLDEKNSAVGPVQYMKAALGSRFVAPAVKRMLFCVALSSSTFRKQLNGIVGRNETVSKYVNESDSFDEFMFKCGVSGVKPGLDAMMWVMAYKKEWGVDAEQAGLAEALSA